MQFFNGDVSYGKHKTKKFHNIIINNKIQNNDFKFKKEIRKILKYTAMPGFWSHTQTFVEYGCVLNSEFILFGFCLAIRILA